MKRLTTVYTVGSKELGVFVNHFDFSIQFLAMDVNK